MGRFLNYRTSFKILVKLCSKRKTKILFLVGMEYIISRWQSFVCLLYPSLARLKREEVNIQIEKVRNLVLDFNSLMFGQPRIKN